jgi:D-aminopeptidase
MDRIADNQSTRLEPVAPDIRPDIAGVYRCDELDATLNCVAAGGILYGAFSGYLGRGTMEPLIPAGTDLWRLRCPRALDYPPPGDWTLKVLRDEQGAIAAIQVGCWLARHNIFART